MRIHRGFTLIELMVVVAVLGILLGVGVPGMAQLVAQSRVSSAAADFHLALQSARSMALTQRTKVSVCPADRTPCTNAQDWTTGWATYTGGEEGVRARVHALTGVIVASEDTVFTYNALGFLEPTTPREVQFSANNGEAVRWICVSPAGSASVSREPCA